MPFPVTPLRVRFDAGPNLEGVERGGEGEGMEGVRFDGVGDDDDDDGRREGVRRRILAL